jgi:hypothetical protein
VGDGATVGVGVDEQDLTPRGGRLEGEVDRDRGPARPALRPPHGGQDPPGVVVGGGRDVRLWRRVLEVGFGQGGAGLVDERLRRVGVGGDVQEPELAEPALAVLVAAAVTPTTASPAAASRARASRSSPLVPAATTATSAWPARPRRAGRPGRSKCPAPDQALLWTSLTARNRPGPSRRRRRTPSVRKGRRPG